MIVVIYDTETRRAVSVGSTEPQGLSDGLAVYLLPEPYEMLSQYVWDPETLTLVPRPPVAVRTLSKRQFRGRFSVQEKVALKLAAHTHPDATMRATIQVLEDELRDTSVVELDDPDTILGANVMVDVLVGVGLVAPTDRGTRVAALLGSQTVMEAAREGS